MLTGASGGIGRATALRLARPGRHIALLGRRVEALMAAARDVEAAGGTASVHVADLRDDRAVDDAVAGILTLGEPDVVILNAGRSNSLCVDRLADRADVVPGTAAVNYLGQVRLFLGLLPSIRRGGHLVGVTTVNARIPTPGWSAYAASKAAFDSWLASVRPELAELGITTSIVAFPLVNTPMIRPVYGDSRRGMSPEAAAGWIERAVERRRYRVAPWWLPVAEVAAAAAPATAARVVGRWSVRR